MSRTYRRRGERHEYCWVLRDPIWIDGVLVTVLIDPRSKQGRRAIARFHSDACWTLRSTAPRWCRRVFDHRLRTLSFRVFRRWLDDPGQHARDGGLEMRLDHPSCSLPIARRQRIEDFFVLPPDELAG